MQTRTEYNLKTIISGTPATDRHLTYSRFLRDFHQKENNLAQRRLCIFAIIFIPTDLIITETLEDPETMITIKHMIRITDITSDPSH